MHGAHAAAVATAEEGAPTVISPGCLPWLRQVCQLKLKTLRYKEQLGDNTITDARTIRGFIIVFLRTLLGRDPSLKEIESELNHLRTNSSSALFHGYGWELIIGDEIYEKN